VVREEDGWGYGGKQLTRKIGPPASGSRPQLHYEAPEPNGVLAGVVSLSILTAFAWHRSATRTPRRSRDS